MKIKTFKLLTIALALLVSSCTVTEISDISSDTSPIDTISDTSNNTSGEISSDTSSDTSSNTSDSSSESSSSDSSSGTNTAPEALSIEEIRVLSLALEGIANSKGVGTSTQVVEFTGKLLARLDAITTQKGYGNRYKLLFADQTGYIYVKADEITYDKVENGIGDTYRIVGNPSLYVGEAEVVLINYYSASAMDIDLSTLAEEVESLAEVHSYISSLRLNSKGVAFSKIIQFDAKYIGKAANAVLLFTDGENAIYLHGDSYIGNRFTLNASYRLFAAATMFNFRPGVEFLDRTSIDDLAINLDISELATITGNELYNYQYETDENATYPNYSSKFTTLMRFEGYVNYYFKNGEGNVVLTDAFRSDTYDTYQGAANAKTIFVNNDNCMDLYSDYDYSRCPFDEYFVIEPVKIEVVFMPYLWNTKKYWQGFFLIDTINVIE